jgi:hypothetical protein
MPRYIRTPRPPAPRNDKLVKKLAQELTTESGNLQPLILEERLPVTKSRHVHVIWDAWKDVPDEERANVILDAYTQVEGEEAAEELTLAEGATPQEALALGLLPYKVEPLYRKGDAIPLGEYAKAIEAEAKRTLLGGKAKGLRYARMEDAEAARQRLQEVLPGSSWAVVQEVAVES